MVHRVNAAGLQVDKIIFDLVNEDILPGTGITSDHFWAKFSEIVDEFSPMNKHLLSVRRELQSRLDEWHLCNQSHFCFAEYKAFLKEVGYLVPEGPEFTISPRNVDSEVATVAGPQLVVPIMNARFALNAVNARWGSLYDALYGNDVISESDGAEKSGPYNSVRGQKVINYGRDFLDRSVRLEEGSHHDATQYSILNCALKVKLNDDFWVDLANSDQFVGYTGSANNPESFLFKNNGLHIEIQVDANHNIGSTDKANIKDIVLESALSTIMDCEDSVAAVDASDKALVYRNWLGLNKGNLEETVTRGSNSFVRKMNYDRCFISPDGSEIVLKGRSLMFVRNVGHLMTNPAILCPDGSEIPEGIMDGVITSLIGLHDINGTNELSNSDTGSIYIVKPKMHGPEEVAFTNRLFDAIEDALGISRNTLKVGIMDEERRTSVNLKECIREAKDRVVFINTGFLDRTGDEIHTSMHAGVFALKADLKKMAWINAYEDQNVDIGLQTGFSGRAQIGKGMWAIPDNMADMMEHKQEHPKSGATCAWVPSPTAATLHAIHYHQVDVHSLHETLSNRSRASVDDILTIPLCDTRALSVEQINNELDNNIQGILGYVVRWVEQGIGCSKVPDINNIGLMEDRATLRISSQHIANWLHHGICSTQQVEKSLRRMAEIVDAQNKNDLGYVKMGPDFEISLAFNAARDLILKGVDQPSGYTEPLLHGYRQEAKARVITS
jgi:malate synthase